jgi:hypothetical protein
LFELYEKNKYNFNNVYSLYTSEEVAGGIHGPKMKEVTGRWKRLHNEQLHNLYASPKHYYVHKIKKDKMEGDRHWRDEKCI